ncbi:uncharacterized protein METZ01_LOCUS459658 [marine metagenome]|uniref:Toxin-antitoxin system YwqK family antitoxin n=1 Tax=marine metagenome TaxID=408172 RepID=A0A383AGK8_9ZZZZ
MEFDMKRLLPIVLFISVGFSQELIRGEYINEKGGVTVFYYKETQNKVLKVKSDSYYRNGQKWEETTYKDGKKDGKWTTWNPNGLKSIERTYKDGEPDGLWTVWYENGQKKREVIYKDKKRFSYKTWNRDGSVME